MPSVNAPPTSCSTPAVTDEFANGGQQRNNDDAENHQREVILDDWNIAKRITRYGETADPCEAAQRAEQHEQTIIHQADACHERRKGTDDGQEAREQDGFAAMFLIKGMSLVDVLALDKPVCAFQQAHSDKAPDPVIGVIAAER